MSVHQSPVANTLEQLADSLLVAAQQARDGHEALARASAGETAGRLLAATAGPVDTVRAVADAKAAVAALEARPATLADPMERSDLSDAVGDLIARLATVKVALDGHHPLTLIRVRHGLSYSGLATLISEAAASLGTRRMGVTRQKVWRWEHWGVVPERAAQAALALLLGAPDGVVAAKPWPAWLDDTQPVAATETVTAVAS